MSYILIVIFMVGWENVNFFINIKKLRIGKNDQSYSKFLVFFDFKKKKNLELKIEYTLPFILNTFTYFIISILS